ncbi:hypothetical protein NH340_JMT07349 [Sarcoptes scabiei]|nr:hypothetical protein NH340_JMT07349 [Sarcoptes scabiei]
MAYVLHSFVPWSNHSLTSGWACSKENYFLGHKPYESVRNEDVFLIRQGFKLEIRKGEISCSTIFISNVIVHLEQNQINKLKINIATKVEEYYDPRKSESDRKSKD